MQAVSNAAQLTAFKADYFNDIVKIVTDKSYGSSDKRYSNLEAGLRMASDMLDGCSNANKYIVLLSDGMPSTYVDNFKDIYSGYVPASTGGSGASLEASSPSIAARMSLRISSGAEAPS